MTETAILLRDDRDGIAHLTLNRPAARNSLSRALLAAMRDTLAAVAVDPAVRVVIISGAGPAFCAGHDLKELRDERFSRGFTETLFADCAQVMQAILHLPQPVIAQVHGIAADAREGIGAFLDKRPAVWRGC